jgi:tRNA 2-selenouridine synthase
MEQIRNSQCIELRSSVKTRVSWLLHEYQHFLSNPASFKEKLSLLTSRYGKEQIAKWHDMIDAAHFDHLVEELLLLHYDPSYQSSIVRNFPRYHVDQFVELEDDSDEAFARAAKSLITHVGV